MAQSCSFPSLFELEKGIHFFVDEHERTVSQLQEYPTLWQRLPRFGKVMAYVAITSDWWAHRFLLPILLSSSSHYLEKMRLGSWRRKDEERFKTIALFVSSKEVQRDFNEFSSRELLTFLSHDLPSFWQKRELFRKECLASGLKYENCSWHPNELFGAYCERLEEKIASFVKGQSESAKRLEQQKEEESLRRQHNVLQKMRLVARTMRVKIGQLLKETAELKKQIQRQKRQSFLLRFDDQESYQEVLLLEQRTLDLDISLEEMLSRVPDELFSVFCTSKEELESSLQQDEERVGFLLQEKKELEEELEAIREKSNKMRKKLTHALNELSEKLDRIELTETSTLGRRIQDALIEKGHKAIAECRSGLLKLPGLLFPLHTIEEYVDEIVSLCRSIFLEERKRPS